MERMHSPQADRLPTVPHAPCELPLKERPDDIGPLAVSFLAELAAEYGVAPKRLSPEAVAKLAGYCWPGNVDELRCVIERAMVFARSELIAAADIDLAEIEACAPLRLVADEPAGDSPVEDADWPTLQEAEREHFRRTLQFTRNDQQMAAGLLGLSTRQFQFRLARHGLRVDPAAERDAERSWSLRRAA